MDSQSLVDFVIFKLKKVSIISKIYEQYCKNAKNHATEVDIQSIGLFISFKLLILNFLQLFFMLIEKIK